MAFISTVPPAMAEGEVRAMYERQQATWGYVPNYAKVFSARPEVLARWGRLLAEIRRPLTTRRFELVTFAAALALRNTACSLQHGRLLTEYFADEVVCAMRDGRFTDAVPAIDEAIFRFAQKVATDASAVTSGDVDRLKAHGLDENEIFDIVATAAGRAFFTKLLDGLGVEADSVFRQLAPAFRDSLAVGRPIGYREVERTG